MAKQAYKIPFDLNASYADMEIAIRTKDGIGFKPAPMRNVLAYVIGFLSCFWIIRNTVMGASALPNQIFFAGIYIIGVFMLCKRDPTQRMQASLIGPLLNYIPHKSRVVMTRSNQNAAPCYQLVGIERIDKKSGLLVFAGGTFGYMYRVFGFCSIFFFDSGKNAIFFRVGSVFCPMKNGAQIVFFSI